MTRSCRCSASLETFAYIDADGEWHDIDGDETYVAIKYLDNGARAVGYFADMPAYPELFSTSRRNEA